MYRHSDTLTLGCGHDHLQPAPRPGLVPPTVSAPVGTGVDPRTWESLRPERQDADRLARRSTGRAAVGVVLLLAVVGVAWWAGLLAPRIALGHHGGGAPSTASAPGALEVTDAPEVMDAGRLPLHVTGVRSLVPGVTASLDTVVTLRPGGTDLPLRWTVTDCVAARRALTSEAGEPVRVPVSLILDTWWGTTDGELDLDGLSVLADSVDSLCPR